ncbi:phage distal tail protein [Paenibacillus thalictri]|uniref:Siphovirus-type tail component C-terminal domain-containing protein n=1 Tax=Paenibacillus thalictri TaxID=2527873 RepID=A0A4Q9DLY0_9BACL|nr:phage tail domain-containing protein [Paenibacillus thalictri]TBL76247.1 hypothetical protein EYB31_19785 [Paenibacillus thalictri]
MTIAESLYFVYAGMDSRNMGLMSVTMNEGLIDETYLPEREVKAISVRGRSKPYFQEVTYRPRQIPLKFAFERGWTDKSIQDVARWLCQDYYKPLYFSSHPERIYYAMYKDSPKLLHNGLNQGYIDIVFENIDAYCYSPVYEHIYDLSENTALGANIVIANLGDAICQPIYDIQIVSGTDFSITNDSNGGVTLAFTGLQVNETLHIDCETGEISTDIPLTYRYGNLVGGSKWTKLVYGSNRLNVKGNIKLKMQLQYKML